MKCRIEDMRNKEVVSVFDGAKLGWVCDVELDTASASMTARVIYGRPKFFGLLGREEDIVIPWDKIRLIGDDTVLVDFAARVKSPRRRSLLSGLIEIT